MMIHHMGYKLRAQIHRFSGTLYKGMGGAIGPWLGGFLHDISGNYTGAFILSMGSYALATAAVWVAAPRNPARLRARV
jgi:cyanate permease